MVTALTNTQLAWIEEAYRCHYRLLCLYALHYLGDLEAAEDVVQECFADLWERQDELSNVREVKSYLYRMVRNRCIDGLRSREKTSERIQPSDLEGTLTDEECEERAQIEARLWTAIDGLPERCREAFLLSKRDGLKYQEIAVRLGISVNTVENQVRKALKILRDGAEKIYYFFFG